VLWCCTFFISVFEFESVQLSAKTKSAFMLYRRFCNGCCCSSCHTCLSKYHCFAIYSSIRNSSPCWVVGHRASTVIKSVLSRSTLVNATVGCTSSISAVNESSYHQRVFTIDFATYCCCLLFTIAHTEAIIWTGKR